MPHQNVALVVDGYSTGLFYPAALKQKGLRPVHVASGAQKQSPGLMEYTSHLSERLRADYEILVHDWEDTGELTHRLVALEPVCVMAGCEIGVEMTDILAQALGLPGNGTAQSAARRDKLVMHQTLEARGLPYLSCLATENLDAAMTFAAGLGSWPVVVKPLRSAATEGVRLCNSPDELRAAFGALVGSSTLFGERNDRALIQECALGREFAVNTVSRDGRHVLSDMWEYHKIASPGGAPLYDRTMLVRTLGDEHRAIIDYAYKALDALGIRFGPAHVEVMLTAQGPVLIECAARPMGGAFPQDLLVESLGHTQIQWAVDGYVDPVAFAAHAAEPYRPTRSMCVKSLISTREGAIRSIPGIALAARLPSARRGNFLETLTTGHLPRTVDLVTNSAHIFLCHADAAVVAADWATLRELEVEAQNELFELCPADASLETDDDWFCRVPDELWLKPEAQAPEDADVIWRALALVPGERVLDCPCGDARVGIHLAARGARVTGVDFNPRFIARAGERYAAAGLAATLRVGDMRQLADRGAFDAIVNWFNSFGYFGIEDDFEVLRRFAVALRPGGRLLLEAPNRVGILGNLTCKYDADGKPAGAVAWDDVAERLVTRFSVPEPNGSSESVVRSGVRMYSLAQYKLLLRLAGLELVHVHGEGLTVFAETSRRMILVAVKPKDA
ncbi:methyltransferase domain-containing protein [Desulfovibrio aerotolerans]|uniref:Methyltransferase domain-containing protein n=1 Tax=Solidesulfovibrio aerotolerans TaxID=295255 RepID=A0A7C9MG89_9BACT|nr:methyltransferase domain-containing protein [Solidesulfovibrio aerotolerans]MYL84090.1 methyltransferase domain-containing protein [Solidesulfovibrio aerotolerans]